MSGLMKAAAIERFGPPSVLGLHQLPIPELGPDEILIALTAAGVGVWDAEVRLRVPIARVFSLAQSANAHARLERGHVLGRIVLQIRRPHK